MNPGIRYLQAWREGVEVGNEHAVEWVRCELKFRRQNDQASASEGCRGEKGKNDSRRSGSRTIERASVGGSKQVSLLARRSLLPQWMWMLQCMVHHAHSRCNCKSVRVALSLCEDSVRPDELWSGQGRAGHGD
jgi:hypothetical protein